MSFESPEIEPMLAVRVHKFGPPSAIVIEDIAVPAPGPTEVLVRVHASGVGPWDAWIRAGQSQLGHSLPLTLGSDFAGTVEALGSEGGSLQRGERVFGVCNASFTNANAEFALAPIDRVAVLPERLDFNQGASVPVIAVTAWQMLFELAAVEPRQTVLVLGARGNVGSYVVQLGRRSGLNVIELNRGSMAPDEPVDAVIDLVGEEAQRALLPTVKRGGIWVSAVAPPPADLAGQLGVRAKFFIVDVTSARLSAIAERFRRGELETRVGTVLPLAEARRAHEQMAGGTAGSGGSGGSGGSAGKIVLTAP
jgi:NADPH:quinone reductase-like Zn-dependent oxidoreductase